MLVVNGGVQADANGNLRGPGSVSLLDATMGAVLRTVPAGRGLGAIAVDAQTQRAFVLGETTVSTLDTRSGAVVRTVTPRTGTPAVPGASRRSLGPATLTQPTSVEP